MAATEHEFISHSSETRVPARHIPTSSVNVGSGERWLSSIGGGALLGLGLQQRSLPGLALAALGSVLTYRGITGHSGVYTAVGMDTAGEASGIDVRRAFTIQKPAAELYEFWRNFQNLPQFMDHLQSVTITGETRSHWVAKAPAGTSVEWDAEITDDRPNEMIAWRSLPGADVQNHGEVRFEELPHDRGTVVHVSLTYNPPAGVLGAAVARLFGEEPNQQVYDDLRRFKNLMEAGEIPTTEGQPRGERSMLGKVLSPKN
jgi:uncharacterized membrane protein